VDFILFYMETATLQAIWPTGQHAKNVPVRAGGGCRRAWRKETAKRPLVRTYPNGDTGPQTGPVFTAISAYSAKTQN